MFLTHDTVRAGANRRHHVHGRRHRQQQSDRRLRAERLDAGDEPIHAAAAAGATRFRPVLMTALAMIIGMGPMALSAEQNAPLGRAVIGGLAFATTATLLLLPVLISLAHGFLARRKRKDRPMSHYDPAHMPPPDPEAQAVLAGKARRWLIGLALVALALAIWGVVSRRARDADLTKLTLEAATPTVELVTPQVSTAVQELILPANVEAFYDAPIFARVNGYLKSWAHDIGDRVRLAMFWR